MNPSSTKTKPTGAESIHWDLTDLFDDITDPRIQEIIDTVKKQAQVFRQTYKNKVKQLSPKAMATAYKELESLLTPIYKAGQYSSLVSATDTSNDQAKALESKLDDVSSEVSNLILFFDLEIGLLNETEFNTFFGSDELKNYAYSLEHSHKTAQYNLSEKEEQVVNLKDLTGSNALQKLYSELTSSFSFEFELDGEKKTMNGSELRALRQHEDPSVRQRAMKLFFSRYEDHQLVLSHLFNNITKDHAIERKMRGYASAISVRNVSHDLNDQVVEVLHDITSKSYPLVQRYYKLKSTIIGIDKLTLSDIYAPMPKSAKSYSWNESKAIVLDSFQAFDNDFYKYAKQMFDENRIDAPVQPKKRGGAFCSSSTPDVAPYVLLNFLGKPRDVSTIAHELGHAIHDYFSAKQTLTNYHPILPLAETASVFSEMIVTDKLLNEESDKVTKQSLLTEKLEDIFATSHRQNMFSRFEMATHRQVEKDRLSTTVLCEMYMDELKQMFGDSVTLSEEYKWEWSAIPHIYEWPFYVYAYNFGNLLVMALYQLYKEQGDSFIPSLKGILSAGSSESPDAILGRVGIRLNDESFWKMSLDYIEGLINELEELVKTST